MFRVCFVSGLAQVELEKWTSISPCPQAGTAAAAAAPHEGDVAPSSPDSLGWRLAAADTAAAAAATGLAMGSGRGRALPKYLTQLTLWCWNMRDDSIRFPTSTCLGE